MLRLAASHTGAIIGKTSTRAGRYPRARAQKLGLSPAAGESGHNATRRSRSALPITLTEDSAIAAAPIIGDSRIPKAG